MITFTQEIALRPYQCCNLTEINAGKIKTQEEFNAAARAGAFLGTLQAGYTDFHYLNPEWRKTTEEDALLGVGVTGIGGGSLDNLDKKEAALAAVAENIRIAKLIGINPAARVTTVKPAGTSSLVLGCSSGIHAWHDDYYIRRIRFDKNEAIAQYLLKAIPELVEDDQMSPTGVVCSFPQKAPEGAHMRSESPMTLLERVKEWNVDWVRTGHIRGDNTNNVSCTISLKDGEWPTVGEWMWENREYYNGISVLPYDGGTYVQTPFESCTKEVYEEMLTHFNKIDLTQVIEIDDHTNLTGEVACAGGACEI
jgi:ribonucleoside-diphosphate reductase alpha chain